MALLDYLFAAIPMLGILIFVHEFGHFIVAKACGVRVLKFSLGFGPPIGIGDHRLRWERGGTEYVIAWFPLGGFVRMLGEQLPGDESRAHAGPRGRAPQTSSSTPSRRGRSLRSCFAGPGMNLVLPVVIFTIDALGRDSEDARGRRHGRATARRPPSPGFCPATASSA